MNKHFKFTLPFHPPKKNGLVQTLYGASLARRNTKEFKVNLFALLKSILSRPVKRSSQAKPETHRTYTSKKMIYSAKPK
jgi:hypothetical protein